MEFNTTDCKNPTPAIADLGAATKEKLTALNAKICDIAQESIIRDNALAGGLNTLSGTVKTLLDATNVTPEQLQAVQGLPSGLGGNLQDASGTPQKPAYRQTPWPLDPRQHPS